MSASVETRLPWLDIGRGTSMILVTLLHTTFVVDRALGPGIGIWTEIDEFVAPLRMPLFFFVSGLLAAGAVRRPLRLTRRRTLGLAYLYVLWSIIQLVHLAYSTLGSEASMPDLLEVAQSFLFPTGLWFFWALALYFFVSHLIIRVMGDRSRWLIPGLLALSVMAPIINSNLPLFISPLFGDVYIAAVCANFVWFYLALHVRSTTFTMVASATWRSALIAVLVYAVLYVAAVAVGLRNELRPLLSAVVLLAALHVLGAVRLPQWLGRSVAAVGRRTLPIYALQWMAIHIVSKPLLEQGLLDGIGDPGVVASVATPIIAFIIIASTWWIGGVLLRSPLAWLFTAPRWLVGPTTPIELNRPGGSGVRQDKRILR